MDNQQPHLPSDRDIREPSEHPATPPLLGLSNEQRRILIGLLQQSAEKILAIQFNDPETDGLRMRQHSYCYGAMDTFHAILNWDKTNAEEFETKLRDGMASADKPADNPFQF